jgi:hypothetical protein
MTWWETTARKKKRNYAQITGLFKYIKMPCVRLLKKKVLFIHSLYSNHARNSSLHFFFSLVDR